MSLGGRLFSTDAFPQEQRLAAWNETLRTFSLRSHCDGGSGLTGSVRSATSPLGVTFAVISSIPQRLISERAPGWNGLWLFLHLSGAARFRLAQEETVLGANDLVYIAAGTAFDLTYASDFRTLQVGIPRSVLNARLLAGLSNGSGLIRGAEGLGSVFSDLLASVAGSLNRLQADELRAVELVVVEFLASSLAGNADQDSLRGETRMQTSILNRVCQIIESYLGDPDFSSADAASKAGISERYMQKILDTAGETFSHYLRLRRLERSRAELVDPRYAQLSITEICYRGGFSDSAHFSRTFREQYNTSPRAYRKTGMAGSSVEVVRKSRGWPTGLDKELRRVSSSRMHEWLEGPPGPVEAPAREDDRLFPASAAQRHHYLPANEKTVHWGYFSKSLPPVISVASGELITIETLTHHANDDRDRMVEGDPGAESVFRWTPEGKAINRRGAGPIDASVYGRGAGEGFGVQICTGPVAIKGAEPGDVIEIRILNVRPRPSARHPGKAFGSNAAAWWGYHYNDLLTDPKPREVVTIYEVDCDRCSEARAVYNYRWTPQRDPSGVMHATIDYPGIPVDRSTIVENHGVLHGVRVPLRAHFGVIGLAPKEAEIVDSTPPSYSGGNLDNWRAGAGSSLFLPVSVPGGLLSIGDPHASQGDSELCGTAIECSLTGTFQLVLHKKGRPSAKPIADLDYPLLETPTEWVIHGFSHANYLADLGENAQSAIYEKPSLDPAMRDAFWKMRRFLMIHKRLTEDEALSLISVAVDFGVTQVVDGNLCIFAVLRKELFEDDRSQ